MLLHRLNELLPSFNFEYTLEFCLFVYIATALTAVVINSAMAMALYGIVALALQGPGPPHRPI
jgi:hypothetical protein